MKNKKAFTLIELVSVLVILAILALIVTPLVLNIIRKARVSADKRSIDAYGRSIELAIADYLLDKGTFPTSIEQLTIEYSGDKVECTTTQLREDSSVYLAECTVGGRNVSGYTYGKTEEQANYTTYSVGDEVTYNNVDYYVIKDSNENESTVTLLKAEPITSNEISPYLSSSEVASKVNTNGKYAIMAYYSADNCVSAGEQSGCSTDYSVSDIKQVIDIWKTNYASGASESRLITRNDLTENLGYEIQQICTGVCYSLGTRSDNTPNWVYNIEYKYWTMSTYNDSAFGVWVVDNSGGLRDDSIVADSYSYVVRPVITIKKSALN